jgi:hypothetical protein
MQLMATSESTLSEPLDHPTAARALEWAREWYPSAELAVTGISDAEATVLVEVDGDIRFLRYENLDADIPRCEICGRPL